MNAPQSYIIHTLPVWYGTLPTNYLRHNRLG